MCDILIFAPLKNNNNSLTNCRV